MLPANQNFKKFGPTTEQFTDFYGHQARQKSPPSPPSPPPTLRSALERGALAIRAQKENLIFFKEFPL